MKRFEVELVQHLVKTVIVDAKNGKDAEEVALYRYNGGAIKIDYNNADERAIDAEALGEVHRYRVQAYKTIYRTVEVEAQCEADARNKVDYSLDELVLDEEYDEVEKGVRLV